ncbi:MULTISPECIES: helix-turn-helix domain-containing protein [unclassified Adlercreutzia]|uniref:helix-turn-helix domain-containing protein n=1 Tax=unclassified Adlercreutzia TaxID=2636013 RepID=UPI0013EBF552|nr:MULTISPECIES: XRE family transcriptional regulator [unclassified Adlercreutzia]
MDCDMKELAQRIQGLREACDVSAQEMADDIGVSLETYKQWENYADNVPISAIYHMAHRFGVDMTEILTGTAAKLDTYHVVRRGEGRVVDRHPGYHFEDMAWRYRNKMMQPLVVILEPSSDAVELITHKGQEFNFVIEGSVIVTVGDKEFTLNEWDSIYFNPEIPHGQRCAGNSVAKFVTIIAE